MLLVIYSIVCYNVFGDYMRVISGKYKGKNIEGFNINGTRPTMDRVKESLFGSIQEYIDQSIVLDLFAGSGALGLESLSRGAKKVVFCDNSMLAIKTIKQNLFSLKEKNVKILCAHYEKALKILKEEGWKFDVIFLDPPYKMKEVYERVRNLLIDYNLLNENAILVEESNAELKGEYGVSRNYRYGIVHVRITKEIRK